MTKTFRRILLTGIAGFAAAGAAHAQVAESATPAAQTTGVDEVVVTARKRSEALQNIPVSVTAVTSENILRAGVNSLADVARLTPNLTFYQGRGGNLSAPIIRGLAPQSTTTFDNNVGVFLDGVYVSAKSNLDLSLFVLDRVEVVRGPQSALYGNNTFSGALNYVTTKPTNILSGEFRGTAGSDGRYDAFGSVSAPLIKDVLSARLSGSYSQFDGTILNLLGGKNLGGWNYKRSGSLDVLFTPTPKFTGRMFYYYGDMKDNGSPGIIETNNCGGLNTPAIPGRDHTTNRYFCGTEPNVSAIAIDTNSFDKTQTQIGSLNLAYDFGKVTLRSLTSIGSYRASGLADQLTDTFTPDALRNFTVPFVGPVKDHSTEVRLESFGNKVLDLSAGGYYYSRDAVQNSVSGVGPTFTKVSLKNRNEQYTEDFAGFGLAQVNITSKLRLNGEVRYTTDANHANITNLITGVSNSPATTFNYFTYRASADYRWSGDFLTYASVATGEKSGGFNNTPVVTEQTFGPEKNTTYEAGFKTQLFDHRLALEAAGFYIDWNSVQLSVPSAATANVNYVANFGSATADGFEAEFQARPWHALSLSGGVSYTNPTWKQGTVDYTSSGYCPTAAVCGLVAAGLNNKGYDVSGKLLPHVSRYQAQISGTYTWDFSDLQLYVRGDVTYRSQQVAAAPIDLQFIPAQTYGNARVGVVIKKVDFSVWVDNIGDSYYPQSGVVEPLFGPSSSYSTAFIGNGRTIGATADYRF